MCLLDREKDGAVSLERDANYELLKKKKMRIPPQTNHLSHILAKMLSIVVPMSPLHSSDAPFLSEVFCLFADAGIDQVLFAKFFAAVRVCGRSPSVPVFTLTSQEDRSFFSDTCEPQLLRPGCVVGFVQVPGVVLSAGAAVPVVQNLWTLAGRTKGPPRLK